MVKAHWNVADSGPVGAHEGAQMKMGLIIVASSCGGDLRELEAKFW